MEDNGSRPKRDVLRPGEARGRSSPVRRRAKGYLGEELRRGMARTTRDGRSRRGPRRWWAPVLVAALLLGSGLVALLPGDSRPVSGSPADAAPMTHPGSTLARGHSTRTGASIGSVLSTLDIATNEVLPGAASFTAQNLAEYLTYDSHSGTLFVRGDLGNDISAVDLATGADLRDIAVPLSQHTLIAVQSMLVDAAHGRLYAANANAGNVSVINDSTEALVASVGVGGSPYGLALDPSTGTVFSSDYGASNVTAFSTGSLRTTANITVGSHPGPILFDPASDQLFVADTGSANVSVINASTRSLVTTLAVKADPLALALDTADDYVDVLSQNAGVAAVTVLNARNATVRSTILVGGAANDLLYVGSLDRLFVAVGSAGNVTAISQATGKIVGSAPTGTDAPLGALSYGGTDGDVYVACLGTNNVTVFNASTYRTVANLSFTDDPVVTYADSSAGTVLVLGEGNYEIAPALTTVAQRTHLPTGVTDLGASPTGIAFDSKSGRLYVADSSTGSIDVLDAASDSESARGAIGLAPTPAFVPVAYDSNTSDLYAANPGNDSVLGFDAAGALASRVPVGLDPVGLAAAGGSAFAAEDINGSVARISEALNSTIANYSIRLYDNVRIVYADATNLELYVGDWTTSTVQVISLSNASRQSTLHVGSGPSCFAYDPLNQTLFVANSGSGNVSVISTVTDTVAGSFALPGTGQLAYDASTNALYSTEADSADVEAVNASTYLPLAGSPLALALGSFTTAIAYDSENAQLYVTSAIGGTVSAIGAESTYSVTFTESGLAPSTSWGVTLGGTPASSMATSILYEEPAGSYGFSVAPVPGYTVNESSGTVVVSNGPKTVELGFTPTSAGDLFEVLFLESGLPATHNSWTVGLKPTPGGTGYAYNASSSASVGFLEPNGSYAFVVENSSGYVPSPSAGSVTVAGGSKNVPISFAAGPGALLVRLVADPASFAIGGTTTLNATVTGGLPPYSLAYSNLPMGCTSANETRLPCTPSQAGSYTVKLLVTDSRGSIAAANTSFEALPKGAPSGASNRTSSTSLYLYFGVGIAILLVLLALVAILLRRRRHPPATPPTMTGLGSPPPPPR
jgi:YVTN family beta-propeller protein